MDAGTLDSRQLTKQFLGRIQHIDQSGPKLRAVLETNPDALKLAGALDAKRTKAHGPLYGIPVLLKDNIDTGDRMLTTAGSLALTDAPAPRDSALVEHLRSAGVLILGKTNLSEWADMRSDHASSGWSGVGGQTRNPYALDHNPCGSSPLARSVADAAALLSVIAGSDSRDPATAEADKHATDYTRALNPNGLKGKRIGVVRQLAGEEPNADRVLEQAIATMKAQGAIIVDPVTLPHLSELNAPENMVLQYDLKHDLNAYLATRTGLKVHTLADLIAFNQREAALEMPWFGQQLFEQAQARGPLTDKAYLDAQTKAKQLAGPEGIDATLAKDHLDALLAPSWGPAFVTDLVLGDHIVSGDPNIGGASQPAAVAGYPSITVPAGWAHGLPVGIVFFGAKWSESTLISIAYGFEQHSHAWQPPKFLDTVDGTPVAATR